MKDCRWLKPVRVAQIEFLSGLARITCATPSSLRCATTNRLATFEGNSQRRLQIARTERQDACESEVDPEPTYAKLAYPLLNTDGFVFRLDSVQKGFSRISERLLPHRMRHGLGGRTEVIKWVF